MHVWVDVGNETRKETMRQKREILIWGPKKEYQNLCDKNAEGALLWSMVQAGERSGRWGGGSLLE